MRISFLLVCGITSTGAFLFPTKSSINNNKYCNVKTATPFVAQNVRQWRRSIPVYTASSSSSDEVFVDSQDGETLQSLYSKKCDANGLMTKEMVRKLPVIAELLSDGDLLLEEFEDIWNAAPKASPKDASIETITLDSFLQIYRDIDNLFEDDEDDDDDDAVEDMENSEPVNDSINDDMEDDLDNDEAELRIVFDTLCDTSNVVSKGALREWSEIKQLIEDEMLGEDEFDELWSKTPKSSDELDFTAFLQFNNALDELFEFDEEEDESEDETDEAIMVQDEEEDDDDVPNETEEKELPMVKGDDLPPGVLFAELANDKFLVGKKELKRWVELQEMLEEGDLLPIELENMYDQAPKVKGTDKMDEIGFTALYEAIDSLFEEVDNADDSGIDNDDVIDDDNSLQFKQSFLQLLNDVVTGNDILPCGLECSERQANAVLDAANMLETLPSNLLVKYDGDITQEDLAGEWDMIYSSSSTMKFNQGLSGLGGSFPNGKFAGVTQKLVFTKFLSDVEYLERIEVNPGSNSFDVKVTGSWELKQSVSLFTGAATTAMRVVPDKVSYGPTIMRADHWKSLGPMNLLDITYLDEDLRIMRGTTSTDTLFIFKRKS